ncbi:MAG: 5-formyltetrahydrofolate cyclo-ligase [Firmicutes bacterium]|nr:5-formyltetrahydrofolate cyclo-ligase [Bacillota bacterium]
MLKRRSAIRQEMLQKRGELSGDEVKRCGALMVERLRQRDELNRARTLLAYSPFRNEVDISGLLRDWPGEGRTLLLPVTDWGQRVIRPVQVRQYPEDLAAGRFGIMEPITEDPNPEWSLEDIDLVLVPGVAFDRDGYRLGYGQGFYDRLLSRAPGRVSIIGLAYSFQMVDTVYPQPHDFRLPVIVTEEQVVVDRGRIFEIEVE